VSSPKPVGIDPDLATWVTRVWDKSGAEIHEFEVRHCRISGATPQLLQALGHLEQYRKDPGIVSHKIAREIQEIMVECARKWPGIVRFEIYALTVHGKLVGSGDFTRKGEGQVLPESEAAHEVSDRGLIQMFMKHEEVMFRESLSAMTSALGEIRRDREKDRELIERLMKEYPVLLDLMSGLADKSFERTLKMKSFERGEKMKEEGFKFMAKHGPVLLAKLLGMPEASTMAAAQPLSELFESLKGDGARLAKLLELLSPDEQKNLLLAVEAFEAEQAKEKSAVEELLPIGVKQGPPNGAAS
jgi:hypothetical protein